MPYLIMSKSHAMRRNITKRHPKVIIKKNTGFRRQVPQTHYVRVHIKNKHLMAEVEKDESTGHWPWPKTHIAAAYAISIRPTRFQDMKRRLGPWSSHVQMFHGTNGHHINYAQWRHKLCNIKWKGKRFRRGQIGCYDSHARLWKHIASNYKKPVLIMEDDASLFYNREMSQRLHHLFVELNQKSVQWDIIYVGHYGDNQYGNEVATGIHVAKSWQLLCCYLIKPSAASVLAEHAWPMREPCDVFLQRFIKSGKLRVLRVQPRLCYVVSLQSDTTDIK